VRLLSEEVVRDKQKGRSSSHLEDNKQDFREQNCHRDGKDAVKDILGCRQPF